MASIVRGRSAAKPFSVRYRDELGKSRERAFATKGAAAGYLAELERGTAVDPKQGRQPFRMAAERWIETHTGVASTKTGYRGLLDSHLKHFADRPLSDVANDRNTAELACVHHPRGKKMRALLVGTCTKAVNDGIIPGHKLAALKLAKPRTSGHRDIIHATHGQLEHIATGLGDLGLTVWIMRGCGLRIGEALGLDSSDFRNGYTMLRVQRQAQGGKLTPLKSRGAGEYRDVPVPVWLATLVKAHVLAHGPGQLFRTARAECVAYTGYLNKFRPLAVSAGLTASYTPHQLRHAFASALLAQRIPITDVSKWLGHRNFQITYDTYCHLMPDAQDAARSALDSEWAAFKAA